ncbi:MAG: hypothetical protein BroJett011_03980 [Chloroflexota bacterium]|nr:MAG: hypothetical protein BroJett011_03980 [Chloroflexota bacterium]
MAFSFNLQAAVNAIAALERAIPAPSGGAAITAYNVNANPAKLETPDLLPVVVHLPLGPRTEAPGDIPGHMGSGVYALSYEIASLLLIIEAIPGGYPADEAAANLYWQGVCQAFFNRTNAINLCTAAGAHTYACSFPENSYLVRSWPPLSEAPGYYWSLKYTHRFSFFGG